MPNPESGGYFDFEKYHEQYKDDIKILKTISKNGSTMRELHLIKDKDSTLYDFLLLLAASTVLLSPEVSMKDRIIIAIGFFDTALKDGSDDMKKPFSKIFALYATTIKDNHPLLDMPYEKLALLSKEEFKDFMEKANSSNTAPANASMPSAN